MAQLHGDKECKHNTERTIRENLRLKDIHRTVLYFRELPAIFCFSHALNHYKRIYQACHILSEAYASYATAGDEEEEEEFICQINKQYDYNKKRKHTDRLPEKV